MRHFIFTILLVVPLLLTAQSKKEQIATLNLRVDSLSEVLINERVNNEQTLSDKSKYIFQLSQEKSDLEKEKVQLSQEKLSLETEMSLKNSSLDTMQVQLLLAQDENSEMRSNLQDVNNGESMFKDYTGIVKFHDEQGKLEYEIPFKDGKPDGESVKYADDPYGHRVMERKLTYKDGKVEGLCITAWTEWAQHVDNSFRIETLVKDGKRVSQTSSYHNGESEAVIEKIVYKNGTREDGIMRSCFDNDNESYQITVFDFDSGEIVSKKCIYGGDDNDEPYEISCD